MYFLSETTIMKTTLWLILILAFNANSTGTIYSKAPQGAVKFGSGLVTTECWHEETTQNNRDYYAFTTNSYGACPALESPEYKAAYQQVYGQGSNFIPPILDFHTKKHDINDPDCFDAGAALSPMY